MKSWFNISKSINVISLLNTVNEKKVSSIDTENAFDKIIQFLGIEMDKLTLKF